jgi:hypothetical protein
MPNLASCAPILANWRYPEGFDRRHELGIGIRHVGDVTPELAADPFHPALSTCLRRAFSC